MSKEMITPLLWKNSVLFDQADKFCFWEERNVDYLYLLRDECLNQGSLNTKGV